MEDYISYHKIIQLFENYQLSQQNIGLNSFGHGNIVDFGMTSSGVTPTYPFMFVTPQNVSYGENITTWTIQVIFGDRMNDDMSNEIDCISDMSIQAKRFISYIQRGFDQDPPLWDYMDCTLPVTGIPFMERFNDYVAGVSLDIEVQVKEDINACDYFSFEPSPTPSVTPSSTPTMTPTPSPTVTPSITPTKTPTPTPTPKCTLYNIQNNGPSFSVYTFYGCGTGPGSSVTINIGQSRQACVAVGQPAPQLSSGSVAVVTAIGTCP